jgi:hypothetical protein
MIIRHRFTQRFIASIKPPATGRSEYGDTEQPGLYLRCTSNGVKTFSCVFRQRNGRSVRLTIGRFPTIPLEYARKETQRKAGEIAQGANIAEKNRAERALLTFGELFNAYERDRLAAGKRMRDVRQTFERYLGRLPDATKRKFGQERTKPVGSVDWSLRRIDAIGSHELAALVERMRERGLVGPTSNKITGIVSAMYRFAKRKKLYDGPNPAEGIASTPEIERTRFLSSEELPRFLDALGDTPQPWRDNSSCCYSSATVAAP